MRMPPSDDMVVVPSPEAAAARDRSRLATDARIVTARRRDRRARRRGSRRPNAWRSRSSSIPSGPSGRSSSRSRSRCRGRRRPTCRSAIATSARPRRRRPAISSRSITCSRTRRSRRSATTPRRSSRDVRQPGLGVEVDGVVDDTMLAAFLLDPTAEAEPGEAVALRLGGVLLPRARPRSRAARSHSLEGIEVERAAPWAGAIVHALLPIADQLPDAARDRRPRGSLYRDGRAADRAGCSPQVERVGIHIDVAHFKKLSGEVQVAKLAELEAQIFELAGGEFNIGSPKQLGELLFDKLGLDTKGVRRTKTGWSTEAETLEQLDRTRSSGRSSSTASWPSSRARTSTRCRRWSARRPAACTPRSIRSSPRPGGSRRRIRTSRTSRSGPSSA